MKHSKTPVYAAPLMSNPLSGTIFRFIQELVRKVAITQKGDGALTMKFERHALVAQHYK